MVVGNMNERRRRKVIIINFLLIFIIDHEKWIIINFNELFISVLFKIFFFFLQK
jgi:hypothetical protein